MQCLHADKQYRRLAHKRPPTASLAGFLPSPTIISEQHHGRRKLKFQASSYPSLLSCLGKLLPWAQSLVWLGFLLALLLALTAIAGSDRKSLRLLHISTMVIEWCLDRWTDHVSCVAVRFREPEAACLGDEGSQSTGLLFVHELVSDDGGESQFAILDPRGVLNGTLQQLLQTGPVVQQRIRLLAPDLDGRRRRLLRGDVRGVGVLFAGHHRGRCRRG